jgi:hypothetical protein
MRTLIVFALLAGLLLASSSARAQEHRVVLPETPVTLVAKGAALFDVLDALGQQAEVTLTASPHLQDKRATIYAHERPLREVLEAMAEVWSHPQYRARWRQRPRTTDVFELQQHADVDREMERRAENDRRVLLDALERLAFVIQKTGQVPQETELPHVNQLLRMLERRAPLLQVLALAPPQARAAFLSPEGFVFEFGAVPPPLQPDVLVALTGPVGIGPGRGSRGVPLRDGDALAQNLERAQDTVVNIRLVPEEQSWFLAITRGSRGLQGAGGSGSRSSSTGIGFSMPPPQARRTPRGTGTPLPEAVRAEIGRLTNQVDLATLQVELLGAWLGRTVVSDYYSGRGLRSSGLGDAATLEEYLDRQLRQEHYEWWERDGVLHFRNLYWVRDDLREPPARLERGLLLAQHDRGWLTLDEIAGTVWLTYEQRSRLGRTLQMPLLGGLAPLLIWYQALPDEDKAVLAEGGTVPLARAGEAALQYALRQPPGLPLFDDPRVLKASLRQEREGATLVLRGAVISGRNSINLDELPQPMLQRRRPLETGILVPENFAPSPPSLQPPHEP